MDESNREDLLESVDRLVAEPAARRALEAARRLAAEGGLALYLVGGAVRDLVLGRQGIDLDLVLESDVPAFVQALAKSVGGRVVLHGRFGTAVLNGPGFRLDFGRTRRETYPEPGALPVVQPASLADDLARRDFTVNAMALRLAPGPPALIDPHGGLRDLRAGLVRVLHERSFQDDATRMLRAARYAARLSFRLEPRTEAWLERDLGFVDRISGPRLRHELELMFREEAAPEAASLAANRGILTAIHPLLGLPAVRVEPWRQALAGERLAPPEELGIGLIADVRSPEDVESVSERLRLTVRERTVLADVVRLRLQSDKLGSPEASPWAVVEVLQPLAPAAVWAFGLLTGGRVGDACERYLRTWRRIRPTLTGDDLLSLGLAGPAVGEALRLLSRAVLEGRVHGRAEEIALIEEHFGLDRESR